MDMTYYEIDESIVDLEQRLAGSTELTAPLVESLHEFRELRRDEGMAAGQWVSAIADATRRTIARIESHARAGSAPGSILRVLPGSSRAIQGELEAEHGDLFANLRRQLSLALAESAPGKGLAVRLLDSVIARECELAFHLNGVSKLLIASVTPAARPALAPATVASSRRGDLV